MKKFIKFMILLFPIYLVVSFIYIQIPSEENKSNNPEIVSHRATRGLAPENSLEGIELALELGIQKVEIDVRSTNDRKIVLLHDATLDRTTNFSGKVSDYNYSEINLPSLEEAIETIRDRGILFVEIKEKGIEKEIVEIVESKNAKNFVEFYSYDDKILEELHSLDSELSVNKFFIAKFPFLPIYIDNSLKITNLDDYEYVDSISFHRLFLYPKIVNEIHEKNKKVGVLVTSKEEYDRFSKMGVDIIATDYPDRFVNRENK